MSADRSRDEREFKAVPTHLKQLRACMVCSLVKTGRQFVGEENNKKKKNNQSSHELDRGRL